MIVFPYKKSKRLSYGFIKEWIDSEIERLQLGLSSSEYERLLEQSVLLQCSAWLEGKHQKSAKDRGMYYTIRTEELIVLLRANYIDTDRFRCNGVIGTITDMYNLSLDRIDNDKGYSIDNVRLVTIQSNISRNRYEESNFKGLCVDVIINELSKDVFDENTPIDDRIKSSEAITHILKKLK